MTAAYPPAPRTALGDLPVLAQIVFFIAFAIKTVVVFGVFCAILALKNALCFSRVNTVLPIESGTVLFALAVLAWCIAYDVFFIISEGFIKKALMGLVTGLVFSLVSSVLVAVCPPLAILFAVLAVISMVKSVIGVVKMIPCMLLGALITVCLFADIAVALVDKYAVLAEIGIGALLPQFKPVAFAVHGVHVAVMPLMLPYLALTLLVSLNLAFRYSLKMALFRQTVVFLAIPIIIVMFIVIRTMLSRAICEPQTMQQASVGKGKIWVRSYYRANGTLVNGYWRSVPI